jgi:hypothetical protein
MEWLVKILQNFSVYKLGWYAGKWEHIGLNQQGWEGISIAIFVIILVIAAINIMYFLFKSDENFMYLKLYFPLCFLYIITNMIFHLILVCLFMSLGPVIWIILSSVYFVFLLIYSLITVEKYDDYPGLFGFAAFVVQYSIKYEEYMRHKKAMLEKYQYFLNIKYE